MGVIDNQGPTVEGLHREGECNHHFFGEDGGHQGREIIIHFRANNKVGAKLGAKVD